MVDVPFDEGGTEDVVQQKICQMIDCVSFGRHRPRKYDDIDWDQVRESWNSIKDNPRIVGSVLKYKNADGDGLLAYLLMANAPTDLVQSVCDTVPECIQEKNTDCRYALHSAISWSSDSPLFDTITWGDKKKSILRILLDAYPAAAGAPDKSGSTPLHLAMNRYRYSLGTIQFLYEAYPDAAKQQDNQGRTPLHIGIVKRAVPEVVQFLIQRCPTATRAKDGDGRSPLHAAVLDRSSMLTLQALVQAYPEATKEQDNNGQTPLHIAMSNRVTFDVAKFLLEECPSAAAIKDSDLRLPLHCGLRNGGSRGAIKLLLQEYPDTAGESDKDGWTPLHTALANDVSLDVIKVLLQAFPDSAKKHDKDGRTPLHTGMTKGSFLDVITAVLQTYPDAAKKYDNKGRTPLHTGLVNGASLEIVKILLQHYPDAVKDRDEKGSVPLHIAVSTYEPSTDLSQVLRHIVRDNSSPLGSKRQNTPSMNPVRLLLKAYPGAVLEKNKDGHTPLQMSIEKKESADDLIPMMLEAFPSANEEMVVMERFYKFLGHVTSLSGYKRNRVPRKNINYEKVSDLIEETKKCHPEWMSQILSMSDLVGKRNLLGWYMMSGAPPKIVNTLVEAYPESVLIADKNGRTPIYCGMKQQELPLYKLLDGKQIIDNDTVQGLRSLRKGLRDGRCFHQLCNRHEHFSLQVFFWVLSDSPEPASDRVPLLDLNDEPIPGWTVLDILVDADNGETSKIFFQIQKQLLSQYDPSQLVTINKVAKWGNATESEQVASFKLINKVEDNTWQKIADRASLCKVRQLSDWGKKYGRFLGKYKIDREEPPKHISDTCIVVFGTEFCPDGSGREETMALKFMVSDDAFKREIEHRSILSSRMNEEQTFVFRIEAAFTSNRKENFALSSADDDIIQYNKNLSVELDEYKIIREAHRGHALELKHLLVMNCGSGKDLSDIVQHQNIARTNLPIVIHAAKSIVEDLRYLNETCGIMHGDVKARNFVSLGVGGEYAAIDLDNAGRIGKDRAGKKRTSSGYLPPEQAAIEYFERVHQGESQTTGSQNLEELESRIDELKKNLADVLMDTSLGRREQRNKKNALIKQIEEAEDKLDELEDPVRPKDVIASIQYDMWCFGVLLFYLCTGDHLFRVDNKEEVTSNEELFTIMNWNDRSIQERLCAVPDGWPKSLLVDLLQRDPSRRPQSWNHVIRKLQSFKNESSRFLQLQGSLEAIERKQHEIKLSIERNHIETMKRLTEIQKRVDEIPNILVQLYNVNCPYIFDFLSPAEFETMKENDMLVGEYDVTDINNTPNVEFSRRLERAQQMYQCCKNFMDSFEDDSDKGVFTRVAKRGWYFISRGRREVVYMQLLCGWTLEPIVTYKIEMQKYGERLKKFARIGANVCSVALTISMLWNATATVPRLFGFPIPDIPQPMVEQAKDFLDKVNESPPVDDLKEYREKGLNLEDLNDFGAFLLELETKGMMRQCFGEYDVDSWANRTWQDALARQVVQLDNQQKQITFVAKSKTERLGGKKYVIEDSKAAVLQNNASGQVHAGAIQASKPKPANGLTSIRKKEKKKAIFNRLKKSKAERFTASRKV